MMEEDYPSTPCSKEYKTQAVGKTLLMSESKLETLLSEMFLSWGLQGSNAFSSKFGPWQGLC